MPNWNGGAGWLPWLALIYVCRAVIRICRAMAGRPVRDDGDFDLPNGSSIDGSTQRTRQCRCGKLMVARRGSWKQGTKNDAYRLYYWCGECGRVDFGPEISAKAVGRMHRKRWRRANEGGDAES